MKKTWFWLMPVLLLMAFKAEQRPEQEDAKVVNINLRNITNTAFQAGERMTFRVRYGFLTAGNVDFIMDDKTVTYGGRECYRAHGYVKTASSYEWFYKVRDEYHTYFDKTAIVPWYYTRKVHEGSYKMNDTVSFDFNRKVIKGTKGVFKMQDYTLDAMSAFYYARCLNLKNAANGTVFKINAFIDDKIYEMGLTVIKRETISTEFGKVRCIKIAPIMVAGRIFKDNDQMHIWLTDDDNYLPIHVQSPILVGSIKCDLIKYDNIRNPFTALVKK